jgi:hypothetical protein
MTDYTAIRGQARTRTILLVLLIILLCVLLLLASDLTKGVIAGTIGVVGLFFTVLLKLGKINTGMSWVGDTTPLRMLLLSMGLLGFGLDDLISALEDTSASGFHLPTAVGVVLLVMMACLPVGLVMEWRARRRRKPRSGARI